MMCYLGGLYWERLVEPSRAQATYPVWCMLPYSSLPTCQESPSPGNACRLHPGPVQLCEASGPPGELFLSSENELTSPLEALLMLGS